MSRAAQSPTDCPRDACEGKLMRWGQDSGLPDHVELYECLDCGEWYEHDTENGDLSPLE